MGVMIPMKRERMLTIRVTDDEHARLLERCEGKQLAVWMRRVCLGEPVARSGKLPTLAPPLLRQLAAIGNNLNQTARKVNSGQWSSGDRVQVVAALMAIGDELRRLRLAVREQGARHRAVHHMGHHHRGLVRDADSGHADQLDAVRLERGGISHISHPHTWPLCIRYVRSVTLLQGIHLRSALGAVLLRPGHYDGAQTLKRLQGDSYVRSEASGQACHTR